jgi:hypothetical protein
MTDPRSILVCEKCGTARTRRKGSGERGFRCLPCRNKKRLVRRRAKSALMPPRTISVEKLRARNKRWRENNREKIRAHKVVQHAKSIGSILPLPCQRCGSNDNVEAHHEDYSRPLDVVWLCREHHNARHFEIRAGRTKMVQGVGPEPSPPRAHIRAHRDATFRARRAELSPASGLVVPFLRPAPRRSNSARTPQSAARRQRAAADLSDATKRLFQSLHYS